ncbi:IS6 family transposase [Streptomyces viridosporus ATCC 14672]|uniref:IS6 family transposase n=1 Tax=Streptomyces viridosporus (strain ATCC 14672 / DSM 40746 / JCM 4963 / KCTC 9882 / NRRL B-12104 / FH 1290) TaxID=566461 RepID=D5ZU67_STRV1|nr:IS6 family transposase [Streptomyces viridosporus ATCC 14672]
MKFGQIGDLRDLAGNHPLRIVVRLPPERRGTQDPAMSTTDVSSRRCRRCHTDRPGMTLELIVPGARVVCAAVVQGPPVPGGGDRARGMTVLPQYLWRAVDQDGMVLDILVQARRAAAPSASFRRRPAPCRAWSSPTGSAPTGRLAARSCPRPGTARTRA